MSNESTRTGPLVGKLVEGIQADISDAIEQLEGGLAKIRALESHTKGVNGLSGVLKAKGSEIQAAIDTLRGESAGIERKLLGTGREPINERVDATLAKKVAAARVETEAVAV